MLESALVLNVLTPGNGGDDPAVLDPDDTLLVPSGEGGVKAG